MNQILYFSNLNNSKKKLYLGILFISIVLFIIFIIYLLFYSYNNYKKTLISYKLLNSFNISSLYNENTNYKISNLSSSNNNKVFIIGRIQIDKLNISYPILSISNEETLKIAPCRFAGPMPNKIGNLCIAGHNYADNTFFGKLYLLNKKDTIKIFDLNGNILEYTIFKKIKVDSTDLSCTSQNTNGEKIITLITCNNIKNTRTIIQAKESI